MSASRAVAQEWAKGWPQLAKIQKQAQTRNGYIQHAFDGDALTTRWIPMAMSCAAAAMLVPGLFSMYLGINKKE